jgi:hypothetical protein
MVLVMPATVGLWHRQGFRLFWWEFSRNSGKRTEITDVV